MVSERTISLSVVNRPVVKPKVSAITVTAKQTNGTRLSERAEGKSRPVALSSGACGMSVSNCLDNPLGL
ncbi:MAG: hypothetical protein ILA04_02290 [Prevotella sp.]|nr:hypothetical protein [Prevotella sp.]